MTPEPEGREVRGSKRPPDEPGVTWKPIHDKWKTERITGWFAVATGQPDYDWLELAESDTIEPRQTGIERSQPTGDKE